MVLPSLHELLLKLPPLKNYGGGTNPILFDAFITLIILSIPLSLGWVLWKKLQRIRFFQTCYMMDLTAEERGFLANFIKRFHVKNPSTAISNKNNFDRFINRVAHHIENWNLSESDIAKEAQFLKTIRKKFGFSHRYSDPCLVSSRALLINHPIIVTFLDPQTKRKFSFNTKVIHVDDFFLGLTAPEVDVNRAAFENKKLGLNISFTRENDAHYHFDSRLVRIVSHPDPMWYIRHSCDVSRGDKHRLISVPAKLMLRKSGQEENPTEKDITITTLTGDGGRFSFNDTSTTLNTPAGALLNIDIEGNKLMLRSTVTDIIKKKNGPYYRLRFSNLKKEQRLILARYIRNLQESSP